MGALLSELRWIRRGLRWNCAWIGFQLPLDLRNGGFELRVPPIIGEQGIQGDFNIRCNAFILDRPMTLGLLTIAALLVFLPSYRARRARARQAGVADGD